MDLSAVPAGLVGTLVSAAALALCGYMYPSTRWARRIKRDAAILAALSEDAERRAWQEQINVMARRLRLYELHVPWWHRLVPFALALMYGLLIAWFVADERGRILLITEETPAFILGIGSVFSTVGYLYVAMRGGDMHGRSPEQIASAETRIARGQRRRSK